MAVVHWSDHDSTSVTASTRSQGFRVELGLWALMTVAMMVPGTVGMVRRLALDSLFRRRQRNATLFTSVYVAAWIAFAAALLVGERAIQLVAPTFDLRTTVLLTVGLVGAAVWQTTPVKARLLNACHLRTPLAPRGRAADLSVVRYGVLHAKACIGSCWAIMLVMFVGGHDFHLMVPLAAITTYERFVKRPNQRATAAVLFALAALTALGLS